MPQLRKDPTIDRWVIIATERSRRPSDFPPEEDNNHASFCPFCPGHEDKTPPEVAVWGRAEGAPANSTGWASRAVPNKFPALSMEGETDPQGLGMFDMMNGVGAHEVIIESPVHGWDMADASSQDMVRVLQAYQERLTALRQDRRFRYVMIFRNKGTVAGASLAHPHSQIIAVPITPSMMKSQLDAARAYYVLKSRCLFCDLLRQELAMNDRVVEANQHFVVLSPFAACFPFELQIYPKRHTHDFASITPEETQALAETLARNLGRIRDTLGDPAYNLMVQTAPQPSPRPGRPDYWGTLELDFHWRIDILPRLTKIAGFEWGTGFYINPVSPEDATRHLLESRS